MWFQNEERKHAKHLRTFICVRGWGRGRGWGALCMRACVRARNCCWWASAGLLRLESYVQLWFPSTHSWTLTHSLSGAAHSTPQGCDLQPADTNGCLTSAYHNTAACRIMGGLNLKPRGAEQTLTSVAPSCWPYGKQRMIYNTVRQYASRFHHAKLITG